MPRIGGGASHAPDVHVEPTSPEARPAPAPRETRRPYEAAPARRETQRPYDLAPGRAAQSWTVTSPTGMSGGNVEVRRGGPRTEWRNSYALPRLPDVYVTTSDPGVFRDVQDGQTFILRGHRAYAVVHDPQTRNWLLTTPGNPLECGSAVKLNAVDSWILQKPSLQSAGVSMPVVAGAAVQAGAARDAPPTTVDFRSEAQPAGTPADSIVQYLMQNPGGRPDDLARQFGVTGEEVRRIAADVRSMMQDWQNLQRTGLQVRRSVIVGPLTEREKQFIQQWRGVLPAHSLAKIMEKPEDVLNAYVRFSHSLAQCNHCTDLAREEWQHVADADVAGGQRPARVAYTNAAGEFINRWRGTVSDRNLAILMNLPGETIDRYIQQANLFREGAPVPEQTAAAPGPGASLSPQPGPSGHQGALTSEQEQRIIELSERGMSPSTISMYVGKSRESIEALLDRVALGSQHADRS